MFRRHPYSCGIWPFRISFQLYVIEIEKFSNLFIFIAGFVQRLFEVGESGLIKTVNDKCSHQRRRKRIGTYSAAAYQERKRRRIEKKKRKAEKKKKAEEKANTSSPAV